MDDILDQVRDAVEAPIDFEGQRLATLVNYAFMSTVGAVSFLTGYATSNVYYALYAGLVGLVITMIAVVPPWPIYNKNPVAWLSPRKVGGVWVATDDDKKIS